jgi:hypothetical protein
VDAPPASGIMMGHRRMDKWKDRHGMAWQSRLGQASHLAAVSCKSRESVSLRSAGQHYRTLAKA